MNELIDFYPSIDPAEPESSEGTSKKITCKLGGLSIGFDKTKLKEMITPLEAPDQPESRPLARTALDIYFLDKGRPEDTYRHPM